jgi:hypothetical protein
MEARIYRGTDHVARRCQSQALAAGVDYRGASGELILLHTDLRSRGGLKRGQTGAARKTGQLAVWHPDLSPTHPHCTDRGSSALPRLIVWLEPRISTPEGLPRLLDAVGLFARKFDLASRVAELAAFASRLGWLSPRLLPSSAVA